MYTHVVTLKAVHDGRQHEAHLLLHDDHDIDAIIRDTKAINPTLTDWQVLVDGKPYQEGQHGQTPTTED